VRAVEVEHGFGFAMVKLDSPANCLRPVIWSLFKGRLADIADAWFTRRTKLDVVDLATLGANPAPR